MASTAQKLTLTNTGSAALAIASIAISGTNAKDFSASNACGTSLAAAASCTISVTFTPSAAGSRTATLTVTDNSGNLSGATQTVSLTGTGAAVATPTTFTTYLAPYGTGFETITGSSVVLPLRGYIPGGASQFTFLNTQLNATSGDATEYIITAETDGAGGYTLRMSNGDYSITQPAWPYLEMNASGSTITLPTPITVGTLQITAYRFALVGNEFQLDLSVNRTGTFNDQIVIFGIDNYTYSSPWGASDGEWIGSATSAPAVTLSATSLNFGTQTVGTKANQTLKITNSGTAPLTVSSVQVSGTDAGRTSPSSPTAAPPVWHPLALANFL